MNSINPAEPIASREQEPGASSRPTSAALAVGLTMLLPIVLVLLLALIVPTAGAAGGCGGG